MPTIQPLPKSTRDASKEEVEMGEHLAELRGRIVLLTWVAGLSWTAMALLGGWLVIGTCDWLIHLDDPGTRLLLGLTLLGGSGWMAWRHLVQPLRIRLTGSFLAARVESQFPDLQNRVLSAVEFLEHRFDDKLGSTDLQKAVVDQALRDLLRITPSDVVHSMSIRRVMFAGLIVSGLAALTVLLHPVEAAISIGRLALPFAHIPWPRAVELQLVKDDLSPIDFHPDKPFAIARGDTLELYALNLRGRLPERVWFENRYTGEGAPNRESLRQTTLRDAKGQSIEAATIHWVATRGPMYFRVSGGDDNVMPFYHVEVVPPPTIQSMQVTVTPPAYSQRAIEKLPPGVGHVQGLVGTRVEVEVACDKPLKSARLRVGEEPGVLIPLSESGRQFSASFEIKEAYTTNYWFELTDLQGFSDHEAVRYELRGVADGIPEVSIEAPVSDVLLTPDAELPVDILAKDDLRLKEIRITYQIGDEEKLHSIPLFDRSAASSNGTDSNNDSPDALASSGLQRMLVDYSWKMADLKLAAGTRIVFRGEATDDYALGQPHVGKSIPRRITIVSGPEKQKEVASRVGELLDDLKQAVQLQQRAQQQTQELQTQLEKVGELRPQDVDQLGRTELDQRQAASRLSNPADGVETQARQLLEELRSNHLQDPGTQERLERLANELGRLSREELPNAEQSLTQAQKLLERPESQRSDDGSSSKQPREKRPPTANQQSPSKTSSGKESRSKESAGESPQVGKSADNPDAGKSQESGETAKQEKGEPGDPKSSDPVTAEKNDAETKAESGTKEEMSDKSSTPAGEKLLETALEEALEQQSRSLETLKELEESLAEWRDRRDISRDLDSVIAEEEAIQKESSDISQQTMSKSSAELGKQEKAELNKLAVRQGKVAEQLDQFRKQLQQAAESIQKNDPEMAEKLNEAMQELNNQATASKLREAAEEIADNKMGEASEAQQKALQDLRDIVRMMKRRPTEDTQQFLKQTDEAIQEFQDMMQDQQNLADQVRELNQQPNSPERDAKMRDLMEKQEQLAQRMVKAERKLEKLRLRGAADAAHRARKRVEEMMKHAPEAEDADEMQEAMEEALDELEEVERELVLEKRNAQERLVFEQLEKIEDELKSLKTRQEAVVDETERLDAAKTERGTLSRGQLKTLKDLAETERSLQHAAEQMQTQIASAEVFSLYLKRLSRTLGLIVDRLSEREISKPTLDLENDAVLKIENLLAVLAQEQKKQNAKTEKPEQLGQEPEETDEDKPQEARPPGDVITQLAQLKLLKSLQEECLKRTELLESMRDKEGKLPPTLEAELNELVHEQVELADYARNLVAKYLQQQPEQKGAGEAGSKDKEKPEKPEKTEKPGKPDDDPTKIDP